MNKDNINDLNSKFDSEDMFPDHMPSIPLNTKLEQQKEEIRKIAEELRKKSAKIEPIIITSDGTVKKASDLTQLERNQEIIKCTTDPIYFIQTYLTIFDQTQGTAGLIVPFKLFDFQKELIHTYRNSLYVIANKYRQAGISTTTCAYIAWYVMFNSNRQVAIIADKLETARDEIMSDVVSFIADCPDWLRPKVGRETTNNSKYKDTQKLKIYDNDSKLGAFSAKGGLRGMTPTLIFWDETAWTEKGDKFWTAAKPTLGTGGGAIMVSCVTKDTFIYTDKGIKQIKDFIPNETLGAHIIDEYHVLGKDKIRKSNIFFNNGYVDTLKIKTTFSELESSFNHKYWAYKVKDNKYGIYKASELELGDYISIQYGMNIWGNNDDCSDFNPSKNVKNIFKPEKITPDIAYLIGLYISERCGIKRKNRIHEYYGITISCGDNVSTILNNLNLNYYKKDNIHYELSHLNLSEFFIYLGFDLSKKAKQKIIPPRLLEMSKENMIAMIQGIMDGDGWASCNTKLNKLRVGIRLSSKELINQLRIIFSNFGVLTEYSESVTPPSKKVKVSSQGYTITANNENALKYLNEVGFRFERKQKIKDLYITSELKQPGVKDNLPNGSEIITKIYNETKSYGKLNELHRKGVKIKFFCGRKTLKTRPCSRVTLLRYYNIEKNNISTELQNYLSPILNKNLCWTKINSINKSENWTYDFSLPNNVIEPNDFHHSVVYNQVVGYQTPSGYDSVFYPHYKGAVEKKNNFKAVELWWFNDPRYNQGLVWLKNKGNKNEIRLEDKGWTNEERIKLMYDGWEASSPWFERQVADANGDMKKISQELLCSFLGSGDNFIAEKYLKRIDEEELKDPIRQEYLDLNMWIWEDAIPEETYIMAIDASPGHGEDNSTINILKSNEIIEEKIIIKNGVSKKVKIKKHKVEQVAEYYGKVSPQVLAEIAYQYGKRYNDAYAIIDITGGYGAQSVEKLIEIGYASIHYAEVLHKPSRDRLQGYIKQGQKVMTDGSIVNVDLIPGFFIGNNRASVVLELQRAIHMEDVIIHSSRLYDELKTFVTVPGNRVADHKRSFHDDSIMGLSIGLFVINFDMAKFKQSKSMTEKMLNALLTNNSINESTVQTKPKFKPPVNNSFNSSMNPYVVHNWLFKGLDKKK